ncbi:MAG TPA: hypothetical protein VN817_06765, partial [Solirubrobacteraceae bacterium]|nr:hypothetical protein [Solirubrobacteraceae bacterium]
MSHRPLAIVSGLTIGDYLLWNWSLNGSHDVLALVSGLTLPPLAAAFLWLIALTGARLLARARRPGARKTTRKATRTARSTTRPAATATATATATKARRIPVPRRLSGRRAAWLGELREARTIVAEATASQTRT